MNRPRRRAAPPAVDARFDDALRHHQAGRLAEAEIGYRNILAAAPRHADSLHLLGVAAHQTRRHELAATMILRAIAVNPRAAAYHSNLGNVLRDQGKLEQAAACLRKAVGLEPGAAYIHNNLGNVLMDLGRLDEAVACFRQAIRLAPELAEAHYNLGNALKEQGGLDEAAACFRAALAHGPESATIRNNLGNLLAQQGRLDEAVACLRRAIAPRADHAEAHFNLGIALDELGRREAAVASFQRALDLKPDFAGALNNMGAALEALGRWDEAVDCFRRMLELNPNDAQGLTSLANALKDRGRLDEALLNYARALKIQPDYLPAHSNRLFVQNYQARQGPEDPRELARAFGRVIAAQVGDKKFSRWRPPSPGEPLRVGLVSGDLCNHPVGYFLEGLLHAADPARIAFLAFPTHYGADELTARLKSRCAAWTPIHGMTDAAAARLIHDSGVQVLLDLSGHTARNRLGVFAWRPAPAQATWLGYFATTGVAEIDFFIGDPHMAPPGEADHFTETPWRLPEIYYCFTPPACDVAVSGLPAGASGRITFGCFNDLAKVTDAVVAVWARVLDAVPGSQLLLKARQLRDPAVRRDTQARFAAHGIGPERLLTEPPSPRDAYLRAYHRVDIALDPFPYPGGTTSCEALWMGVPLLTRRGDRFLSHAGETIAHNAGLADWIADGCDDYVAKAAGFAADLAHLAALRARLRQQVLASPLCDAPRFARHFEAAMWGMWQHVAGHAGPA